MPSSVSGDGVAAVVDDFVISERALRKRILETFGDNFDSANNASIRSATLKTLIMERIVEKLVSEKQIQQSPSLTEELRVLKRRALLKYYLDQNAQPPSHAITYKEIEQFIAEHPQFFTRRKTYHFGELIIKTPTSAIKQAVKDRLAHLAEYEEPTPEAVQMVVEWLNQNNIVYGYSNVWKASEQIEPDSFKNLSLMDQDNAVKLSVEAAESALKAVVLFNAYPDPLDPLFAKQDVHNRLLNVERVKEHATVMDGILLKAQIAIPDVALAELILPKGMTNAQRTAPAHVTLSQQPVEAPNDFFPDRTCLELFSTSFGASGAVYIFPLATAGRRFRIQARA